MWLQLGRSLVLIWQYAGNCENQSTATLGPISLTRNQESRRP
jgi:hypothetical protein